MAWLKTFLKINWLIVEIQLTDEKSTNTPKVKLWLFLIKNWVSKITFHQDIQKYETWPSRNQESQNFQDLEIFLSVFKSYFFHDFMPTFHQDARWFKENFQHESCRSWWDIKLFFTDQVLEMLGFWVMNP